MMITMQRQDGRAAGSRADPPAAIEGYDDACRELARRIEKANPHWLVMWGAFSREYWAYHLLPVPSGTIVHAPIVEALLTGMREVELTVISSIVAVGRGPGR